MQPFQSTFRGKRVLVTGATGFKGSWLCHWLLELGAHVLGVGLKPATDPSLFSALRLRERIRNEILDVRDSQALTALVRQTKPEIIFHLAAQALVRPSFETPKDTFDTNVGGTVNLLEAMRLEPSVRACVVVTSDKCYENREWVWGYRETDPMGGHDPYSASKGAAELVAASYRQSFFAHGDRCLATARAGNVIGGGDWSKDRLVPDFVRSIVAREPLTLRYPNAVRPWQHVLEPISGYLFLASKLCQSDGQTYAQAWNFGPNADSHATVAEVATMLTTQWSGQVRCASGPQLHETNLLRLDCSKAYINLGWRPVWDVATAVSHTVRWYRSFYDGADVAAITTQQIHNYHQSAARLSLPWAAAGLLVEAA